MRLGDDIVEEDETFVIVVVGSDFLTKVEVDFLTFLEEFLD